MRRGLVCDGTRWVVVTAQVQVPCRYFAPAGTAPYRCERMKAVITYYVWRILMQGMLNVGNP